MSLIWQRRHYIMTVLALTSLTPRCDWPGQEPGKPLQNLRCCTMQCSGTALQFSSWTGLPCRIVCIPNMNTAVAWIPLSMKPHILSAMLSFLLVPETSPGSSTVEETDQAPASPSYMPLWEKWPRATWTDGIYPASWLSTGECYLSNQDPW